MEREEKKNNHKSNTKAHMNNIKKNITFNMNDIM
jgi:hypothetical protein